MLWGRLSVVVENEIALEGSGPGREAGLRALRTSAQKAWAEERSPQRPRGGRITRGKRV